MVKITALSKFGFRVQDSSDWISCDKSLLNSPLFTSLKKGDDVDFDAECFNPKGFLISFKSFDVPQHKEIEGGVCSFNTKSLTNSINSSTPPSSIIKNGMIYGQCVNLAFNHVSNNECGLNINEAFDLADKIYIEYNKRVN
jgi:hypothetical protein